MTEIEVVQRLKDTLFYLSVDHDRIKLSEIKDLLNQLFATETTNTACVQVLYTENIDNLFFGIRVYPIINPNPLEYETVDNIHITNNYKVELDSKLFDPILSLSKESVVALVLYNIFHTLLVSNYKTVIAQIDMYMAETGEDTCLENMSFTLKTILQYGISDALMKLGSVFTKLDATMVINDKFLSKYDLNSAMKDALVALATNFDFMRKEIDDRFITLAWCLRIINDYTLFNVPALKTLRKALDLTGSELEKKMIKNVINIMNSVNENFYDDITVRDSPEYTELKQNGIHDEVNNTYELLLNLKACEDSDDCLNIIRKVNNKIELLYAYLEEDIDDTERAITERVLQDLFHIRQEASRNKTVKDRLPKYLQPSYSGIDQ